MPSPSSSSFRRLVNRVTSGVSGRLTGPDTASFWDAVHRSHPTVRAAILADARITARRRGERFTYRSKLDAVLQVLRLMAVTESFFAQCCYRAKARCQARGIPIVPHLLQHLAVSHGQITIGDPAMIEAGVYIPHGQVCIDGVTRIAAGAVLGPFITIGLVEGEWEGPTIEAGVSVGSGARILGPCRIGAGAKVGANAVVTSDVPSGRTMVGVPGRVRD